MSGARRMVRVCVVAGLLPATLPAEGQSPPKVPAFPSGVALITVDAVVVDARGRPVEGLTRDDFVLTEDGRPQEIVNFEAWTSEVERAPSPLSDVVATNQAGP